MIRKVDFNAWRKPPAMVRFWEMLPGLLTWSAFALLVLLSWQAPYLVSYAIILYSVSWFLKSVHSSFHLIHTFRKLRAESGKDVVKSLKQLEGRKDLPNWRDVWHVMIIPTYNEPTEVLQQSINAIARSQFPLDRVLVVVAIEGRTGAAGQQKAKELRELFKNTFARFLTITHPDGLPGEAKVKSANATYALSQVLPELEKMKIPVNSVLVSNFDSDTQPSADYLAKLTEAFVINPRRLRASYQPVPVYHNNIWYVPMLPRISSIGSSFWQMIESSRSHRLVSFSSHALPLRALLDVGGWDVTMVNEDSRIFWQCYMHYHGDYYVVPLATTVSMDAVQAATWGKTLKSLYKQKQRWAYGAENMPYLGVHFFGKNHVRVPLRKRLLHIGRMIEGYFSWATAAIVLAVGGWLPSTLGGAEFRDTVLGQNFSSVSRLFLTIALAGVVVSIVISARMIPPRPANVPHHRWFNVIIQWFFTPIVTIFFGSLPAIDAQTRLMFGQYLGFHVMPKVRASTKTPGAPALAATK
jgi:cellulose synthase/poly-beta-1,6-N-acetylglucosamine synthase-like glycosyltransferase